MKMGILAFNESIAVNYLIDGKAMSFDPKEVWGDICGMIRRAVRVLEEENENHYD